MLKYRFKRSFIDPVNHEVKLYYLDKEGNSKVLITDSRLKEHIWEGIDPELQKDAQERISRSI